MMPLPPSFTTIPLESAGFADVPGFGTAVLVIYLVMVALLAIGIGEAACACLLTPRRP